MDISVIASADINAGHQAGLNLIEATARRQGVAESAGVVKGAAEAPRVSNRRAETSDGCLQDLSGILIERLHVGGIAAVDLDVGQNAGHEGIDPAARADRVAEASQGIHCPAKATGVADRTSKMLLDRLNRRGQHLGGVGIDRLDQPL